MMLPDGAVVVVRGRGPGSPSPFCSAQEGNIGIKCGDRFVYHIGRIESVSFSELTSSCDVVGAATHPSVTAQPARTVVNSCRGEDSYEQYVLAHGDRPTTGSRQIISRRSPSGTACGRGLGFKCMKIYLQSRGFKSSEVEGLNAIDSRRNFEARNFRSVAPTPTSLAQIQDGSVVVLGGSCAGPRGNVGIKCGDAIIAGGGSESASSVHRYQASDLSAGCVLGVLRHDMMVGEVREGATPEQPAVQ